MRDGADRRSSEPIACLVGERDIGILPYRTNYDRDNGCFVTISSAATDTD